MSKESRGTYALIFLCICSLFASGYAIIRTEESNKVLLKSDESMRVELAQISRNTSDTIAQISRDTSEMTVQLQQFGLSDPFHTGEISFYDREWYSMECWERVDELKDRVAVLESKVDDLEDMQDGIVDWAVEHQVPESHLKQIYDSGWKSIKQGEILELCTIEDRANLLVYMMGIDTWTGEIHHHSNAVMNIAHWYIRTDSKLCVYRMHNDVLYDKFRVVVWGIP